MTTSTKAAQPKINLTNEGKTALVSVLRMVGNTARLGEHTTGILADKAERLREQIAISDTIEHNRLVTQLREEATAQGIKLD